MGKTMSVVVCGISGEKTLIDLSAEQIQKMTVRDLKEKSLRKSLRLFPNIPGGSDVEQTSSILIFEGRQLKDNCLLWECGVQHMSTIYLVKRSQGGSRPDEDHGGMGDKDKNQSMEKLAFF
uniref:Ubiquitin-like domain-containing protein n=1 Tax=Mastacembelus armatus TaxID=205130 RepID=A0A3Q3ME82_9TELE